MSDNLRPPAEVSEEGELLAQWLDEQSHYYTSDERAQQNLRRAAAFIREAYPAPVPSVLPLNVRDALNDARAKIDQVLLLNNQE